MILSCPLMLWNWSAFFSTLLRIERAEHHCVVIRATARLSSGGPAEGVFCPDEHYH